MDPGTFHALEVLTHSELLHTYLPKEKEVTVNVCKAIDDLIQDSMAEGMAKIFCKFTLISPAGIEFQ